MVSLQDAPLSARTNLSLEDSTAFLGIAEELRKLISGLHEVQKATAASENFWLRAGKRTPAEQLGLLNGAMRSWAMRIATTSFLRETWATTVDHHSFASVGTPREPVGDLGRWTLGEVTELEARTTTGPLAVALKSTHLSAVQSIIGRHFESILLNPEAAMTARGSALAPLVAALPELAEQISGPADAEDSDPTFLGQSLSIDLGAEENTSLNERLARALGLPLQLVNSVRDVRAACGSIVDLPQDKWQRGVFLAQGRLLDKDVLKDLAPPDFERLESIQGDIDKANALYRGDLLLLHVEELKRATAGLAVSDRFASRMEGALGLIGFDVGALGALSRSEDEQVRTTAKAALKAAGKVAAEDANLVRVLGPDGWQDKVFGRLISHSPAGLLEED